LNSCAAKREDEAGMTRLAFMTAIFRVHAAPVKFHRRQNWTSDQFL